MYWFYSCKLFDGIKHVIDAGKYLTPSNQKRCYIIESIRIEVLISMNTKY